MREYLARKVLRQLKVEAAEAAADAAEKKLQYDSASIIAAHQRGHVARVEAGVLRKEQEVEDGQIDALNAAAEKWLGEIGAESERIKNGELGETAQEAAAILAAHKADVDGLLGRKWVQVPSKPEKEGTIPYVNEELSTKLASGQLEFTLAELEAMQVSPTDLTLDMYVEAEGETYYQPVESQWQLWKAEKGSLEEQRNEIDRVRAEHGRNPLDWSPHPPEQQKLDDAWALLEQAGSGYETALGDAESARKDAAATTIQSYQRGHVARVERERLRLDKENKDAATAIQKWARGKAVRNDVKKQHKAAIQIERCYRGHCARSEANARRIKRDAEYNAARKIQSHARKMSAMKKRRVGIAAAIVLEKYGRGLIARAQRRFLAMNKAEYNSAVWIQKRERMRQQRLKYRRVRFVIIVAQKQYRRHAAVKYYEHARKYIIAAQAIGRMRFYRTKYRHIRKRIINAQTNERRKQAIRLVRDWNAAALVIGSRGRGMVARKKRQKLADNKEFTGIVRTEVTVIQRYARGMNARNLRQRKRLFKAAQRIQAPARGYVIRKAKYPLHKIFAAGIVIQKNERMRSQRKRYKQNRVDIIYVEAHARGVCAKRLLKRSIHAAKVIQAHGRGAIARYDRRHALASVRLVQHRVRAMMLRIRARKAFKLARRRVTRCQAVVRQRKVRKQYLIDLEESKKQSGGEGEGEEGAHREEGKDDERCYGNHRQRSDPSREA